MTTDAAQPAHPPVSPREILLLKRCPRCDYDLTGLPRKGHCPECGFTYSEMMFVLSTRHDSRAWRFLWYGVGYLVPLCFILFIGTIMQPAPSISSLVAVLLLFILAMTVIVVLNETWRIARNRRGKDAMLFNQKGVAMRRAGGDWGRVTPYSAFSRVEIEPATFGKGHRLKLIFAPPFLPIAWSSVHLDIDEHRANALRYEISRRLQACPSCGYNMRATPGQCPECGAVPKRT